MPNRLLSLLLLAVCVCQCAVAEDDAGQSKRESSFLSNGVTAHRGNSSQFPENTLPAFRSGIDVGADWIELDVFLTKDGKLVVTHDATTERVGDRALSIVDSTFEQLEKIDVAADFRRRTGKPIEDCPPMAMPLLEDVLNIVMKQRHSRVSIQPKTDCVEEAIALVKSMKAEQWVGFNDGNLQLMQRVKSLAPSIPVLWDRGAESNVAEDIRIAKENGFEALILNHQGVTAEKIDQIRAAGIESGAWTVNDRETMKRMLDAGVDRIYTDYPRELLKLRAERGLKTVVCSGAYSHHLQGVCTDGEHIYWSFTTRLVQTNLDGRVVRSVDVVNHHGDLCWQDGKLYVAVNLGNFNDPAGNADSWVYVYDATTLNELDRHETQEAVYGAGGIGFRKGRFYVVGGLPNEVAENYVYEYDHQFQFIRKHTIESGHTHLGIQTATFAYDRWWFGCYGSPKILLVTDANFRLVGRYELDCSLGIEALSEGRLLVASGKCDQNSGCTGWVRAAIPDEQKGFIVASESRP